MGSLSLSKTVYFETSDFYACTALIPKGNGVLSPVSYTHLAKRVVMIRDGELQEKR